MTSTPTPEPGERVWRCLLDGSCTATSTDDIGYHVACGWVTLPAPSTPGEGTGRPDTAQLREAATNAEVGGIVDETIITAAADWIDAQPPASPADDVPDADAVAFQNGYRIGVRVGSEHHGPCRGLPPASPVPPTPTPCPYIVTGGEGTSYCSLAERSAVHAAVPPTPAPQADRDKLEIDVEELLIDHCGMGGTSALTDRILALTDAFTFAAAPPSTPAEQPQPDGLSAAELLDDLKDRTERGMVELEKLAAPVGACMERTRLLGKLAGLALVADWLRSYDHPTDLTGSEA